MQLCWDHVMKYSRLFSALMDNGGRAGYGKGTRHSGGANGTANLLSALPLLTKCCGGICYTLQRFWVQRLHYPTYCCLSLATAILLESVLLSEVMLTAPVNLSPFSWTLCALEAYHKKNLTMRIIFQAFELITLLYIAI